MADHSIALAADGGPDDLPRTFRREREAREREAREREAAAPVAPLMAMDRAPAAVAPYEDLAPAAVRRFDVPFLHLMTFFLKAVLAAIPALILLGAILWLSGHLLQTFFPQLIKMKILISFPG
jgi:hypothetical protein